MLVERKPPPDAPKESRYVAAPDEPRLPVLAFVADEQTETALRSGLVGVGTGLQVRRGDARAAVRALEQEPTPSILVVDVSGLSDPLDTLDALAGVCSPDVRVLVVGEASDLVLYRRMTRDLGVAEYLYKPLTRDAVVRFFGPHITGGAVSASAERGGSVISVCGARGGAGTTTIAVNLALQLAEATRGHVALLDLHLRAGTTGMMLGLRSGTGLRVALEDPDRVDNLFLDRSSVPVNDRVRLIAAEEPIDSDPRPSEGGIKNLLAMLTARFNYVVIDVPSPPGVAERIAQAMSQHRLVVMGPDLGGIRDALALRRLLGSQGAGSVTTVLNRAGLPGGLKPKLVADGLGGAPDFTIPDLPNHLPRSANLGQPALAQSTQFRRALAPLTHHVADMKAAAPSPSLFARLLGGRAAR
ncbi:pilus assembly protein [Roseomonas sp. SSH11]|uniref:Pilus assembly protein n=1 Tax=Pararoseomonas baculiformis TaxID=2820812 RepID=A0ABS4AE56_9PROT|nr:division plane positioning ATPase MipZ [Pararoseomonas baculiformis]MBP0445287.1 pilus assembly protein [Pararoseomonas baculiformis]